jgi:hypothetical protein
VPARDNGKPPDATLKRLKVFAGQVGPCVQRSGHSGEEMARRKVDGGPMDLCNRSSKVRNLACGLVLLCPWGDHTGKKSALQVQILACIPRADMGKGAIETALPKEGKTMFHAIKLAIGFMAGAAGAFCSIAIIFVFGWIGHLVAGDVGGVVGLVTSLGGLIGAMLYWMGVAR